MHSAISQRKKYALPRNFSNDSIQTGKEPHLYICSSKNSNALGISRILSHHIGVDNEGLTEFGLPW